MWVGKCTCKFQHMSAETGRRRVANQRSVPPLPRLERVPQIKGQWHCCDWKACSRAKVIPAAVTGGRDAEQRSVPPLEIYYMYIYRVRITYCICMCIIKFQTGNKRLLTVQITGHKLHINAIFPWIHVQCALIPSMHIVSLSFLNIRCDS